ncbi:lasso RiPP family leader peptide-containing protein [uncultured Bradyrhizobium sp.]|uniref:lasso RiPP family leader peptide-containing protein n=1 Tax=uncultured Bradyrhizobium sp. TaxID=199684 RepID=UPI0035CA813A
MANKTLQDQANARNKNTAKSDRRPEYSSPEMVDVGSATDLTQGGSYNDYDSPGVRKT